MSAEKEVNDSVEIYAPEPDELKAPPPTPESDVTGSGSSSENSETGFDTDVEDNVEARLNIQKDLIAQF